MLDAGLKQSIALPAAAGSVYSAGIELPAMTSRGASGGSNNWIITAPALTAGELPDGKTATYDVEHDTVVGFGSVAVFAGSVLVQTGAGGVGAAAATARVGLPGGHKQFFRLKATTSAGSGNCSAKSASLQLHVVADGPDLR